MALADDLESEVAKIFLTRWTTRNGNVVPEPDDVRLGNDAVEFDKATVLYADLSGSTAMVDAKTWQFAAEVYKTYLYCAARIVRAEGGSITSYDGDRIMGVFIGDNQCSSAARCALKINWAVQNIVNPALKKQYANEDFFVKQTVGVDTSSIRAARTGARGGNDLVWVGRAANYAAKLTDIDKAERTWITAAVYDSLSDKSKFGGDPKRNMWAPYSWSQHGDVRIYGSTWWWKL